MNHVKKIFAWVLSICLTLATLPSLGLPAAAASVTVVGGNLLNAYNTANSGDTIVLTGDVLLTEPLLVSKSITLAGTGTIVPSNSFVPGEAAAGTTYNSLIVQTSGTLTIESGVILDMQNRCRGIDATGTGTRVQLNGGEFKRGRLEGSRLGAAIALNKGAILTATKGTRFLDNKSELGSATGGGALYVGGDCTAAPATSPTRAGYKFTGWFIDKSCALPLVSGTVVRGAATFYAGWEAETYTITWDVNYTGGSVTTVQQKCDTELLVLSEPVRTGYDFGGWYTGPNGTGTRAEAYGKVKGNVTFYANWVQGAIDYTVTVDWADQSDNDAVRPAEIKVELTRNDLPTGLTYTLTAADADASGNKWSHTFTALPKTDSVSNEYTYSVAITSPVSSEYTYGNHLTADLHLTARWAADTNIGYQVQHWVELVDSGANPGYTQGVTTTQRMEYQGKARIYYLQSSQQHNDGMASGHKDITPLLLSELAGLDIKGLTPSGANVYSVTMAPDGSSVYPFFYDRSVYTLTFDPNGGTIAQGDAKATILHGSVYGALPPALQAQCPTCWCLNERLATYYYTR